MADYAIGDVQGCYRSLMKLLDHISFDEKKDCLWFVGDLVNRGPDSLSVLRFVKKLSTSAKIVLGNHDLYLLHHIFSHSRWNDSKDTLNEILTAPDKEDIGHWLRNQPVMLFDEQLNVVLVHAGIAPIWSLDYALDKALELQATLSGDNFSCFLDAMRGDKPDCWSENLCGYDRIRLICNYFVRMRFCNRDGCLELSHNGGVDNSPVGLYPWFNMPNRVKLKPDIVFGHWAALRGKCDVPGIYPVDTGCVWGGTLTALRLQDKKRFEVTGIQ